MGNGMGESKGAKTRGVLIRIKKKKRPHLCEPSHSPRAKVRAPIRGFTIVANKKRLQE